MPWQQQVHRAEARDAVHQLDAEQRAVLEPLLLCLVQAGQPREVVMRGKQEAARAAGRVADRLARLRGHRVHHGRDQRARREVLAAPPLTSSAFFCSSPS